MDKDVLDEMEEYIDESVNWLKKEMKIKAEEKMILSLKKKQR